MAAHTAAGNTRTERLQQLVDHLHPAGDDTSLDSSDPDRYLLVEKSGNTGELWFTLHPSLGYAATYWAGQEYPEQWSPQGVIDLDTGVRYSADISVTFTADPGAIPQIDNALLDVGPAAIVTAAPGETAEPDAEAVLEQIHGILTSNPDGAGADELMEIANVLTATGRWYVP